MWRSRTAWALTIIWALMAPITSRVDEATARALQAWAQGAAPLPDLIARLDGLNQAIALPLMADDLQTVREALWRREADLIHTDFERGLPNNTILEPTVFQQMAFAHLSTAACCAPATSRRCMPRC